MTQTLLTKAQLQAINRRDLKYSLAEAEKDYFLAIVTKIINESPLGEKLVFKGGMALHHCYLPQLRFSEDLDFTALERNLALEDLHKVLEGQDFLKVRDENVSRATIRVGRLVYSGVLDTPNSIKLDIDMVQNVVLPPKTLPYRNVWGVDAKANVMDEREICAEKVRAMSERARYRDFYDFYLITTRLGVDLGGVIDLVRQKEARDGITPDKIRHNWEQAKAEGGAEIGAVYYDRSVFDDDSAITKAVQALDFEPIPENRMVGAD